MHQAHRRAHRRRPGPSQEQSLHHAPFDDIHIKEPKVRNVDFPKMLIAHAVHDSGKEALMITTLPGDKQNGASVQEPSDFDPAATYRLIVDGGIKTFKKTAEMSAEIGLDREHDVVLEAL